MAPMAPEIFQVSRKGEKKEEKEINDGKKLIGMVIVRQSPTVCLY